MAAPLVLIADDDEQLRDMLRAGLELRGYRVMTTADGWQAVQVAEHERPAIIILDVHMMVRDGDWVVRQLHEQQLDIPIVLLTGDPRPERWAEELGAAAWVHKPFDFDTLFAKLESIAPVLAG